MTVSKIHCFFFVFSRWVPIGTVPIETGKKRKRLSPPPFVCHLEYWQVKFYYYSEASWYQCDTPFPPIVHLWQNWATPSVRSNVSKH